MSVIQTKYDNLVNTNEPKIIIAGGSSAAFGINEELLREATGYEVVNLGVHAGIRGLYNTEITKANINKGDIVLLGYEYGWGADSYFKGMRIDLVMSGIDSKLEMYKHIPLQNWDEVFGYLFTFAGKKNNYVASEGIYSRSSFDENGRMTLVREGFVIGDYQTQVETYGKITEDMLEISEESAAYLRKYKAYVEHKGASVYFISPPLLDEAYQADKECLSEFVKNAKEQTTIEYLSNPKEYLFSSDLMFDTIYHCNTIGEEYRTKLLIEDLKKVIN